MPLDVGGGDALFFKAGFDTRGVKQGATQIKGIIAGLSKNISKTDVFAGLTIGATIAFGKITAEMYQFTKEFRENMIEVSTISDEVTADIEGVSDAILEMTRALPQSASSLAKAEYQIISAGITDVAESLDVLRVSAELATAGLTDTFTTADALTSIMNAYGAQAGNAEQISDKLFTTVRLGKINMQQLAQNIGMVTGLASQVGLEFDDLTTAISVGTKTLRPEIFFTAMRGFLTALIQQQKEAVEVADLLGIEWSTAGLRAKGLSGFLKELNEVTGGSDKILGQLVPNTRGLIGLLAIGADEGKAFEESYGEMIDGVGSKNEALAKQLEKTGNKTKLFWNNLKVELMGLGEVTVDITDKIFGSLNKLFDDRKANRESILSTIAFHDVGTDPVGLRALNAEKALKALGVEVDGLRGKLELLYSSRDDDKLTKTISLVTDILVAQTAEQNKIIEAQKEKMRLAQEEADAEKDANNKRKKDAEDRVASVKKEQEQMKQFMKETETANDKVDKDRKEKRKKDHDELVASNKADAREEQQLHNKQFRNLLRRHEKFTDKRLAIYLESLKKELQGEQWVAEEKEILLTRIAEIEEDLQLRAIKRIAELGNAIGEAGDILGRYDDKIGGIVTKLGSAVRDASTLFSAVASGNVFGAVASGASLLGGLFTGGGERPESAIDSINAGLERVNKTLSVQDELLGDLKGQAYLEQLRFTVDYVQGQLNAAINEYAEWRRLNPQPSSKLSKSKNLIRAELFENIQELTRELASRTNPLYEALTQTTSDAIADGIADGFASGKTDAELFGDTFNNIMTNVLKEAFTRQFTASFLDGWYEQLALAIESGGELTSMEAWLLGEDLKGGIAGGRKMMEEIFGVAGLPNLFNDGADAETKSKGLSGAIAGITEQTAGLLEGQFNNMAFQMIQMNESMRGIDDIILINTRIRDNTEYLRSIDNRLAKNNAHNLDILRAMGEV